MSASVAAGNSNAITQLIDHGKVTAQQLLVVGLCMFFNMLDGFDITAMAIVAQAVSSDLQLTSTQVGWIFSFALAGMMAGAMLLAPLSDLVGRRRLIIASLLLIGVSVLLTAQADSLTEFVILRFISGAGAGAMLASQATLAAEYSPERFRALAVVAVTAGYPLGAMFTSVVAEYIVPDYGWRGMFVFGGGLTALMAFVALMLIPESLKFLAERQPPKALQRINKILARMGKPAAQQLPEKPAQNRSAGFLATLASLLSPELRRRTLTIWGIFFLGFLSLYFLMSWLPSIMEMAGYSEATGRHAFFLFNLGGVIGVVCLGLMSVRLPLTHLICALMFTSGIAMAVFALTDGSETLRLGLIFVIGVLLQGGFTGMYSAAAKAYPTHNRSTGIGWAIGLGRFGAVVGPWFAGVLIDEGWGLDASFLLFATPIAIAGLIAFTLRIR